MMDKKFHKPICLFVPIVCLLVLAGTFPVLAQSEISLSDYLSDEPKQSGLSKADKTQESGVYSGDALPKLDAGALSQGEIDNIGNQNIEDSLENRLLLDNNVELKSPEELQEEIRQEAFDAAITGLFPLRPSDIETLIKRYDKTQRTVEEPIHGYPTPEVTVQTVSLDPGVIPMTIKTAVGHVTTLNILDVTGAPWPIQDISWAGNFEVTEPEEGGHVIRITPLELVAYGNISIRLLTLKTPITIALRTDKDSVQYRVDARIPEYGPYASAPLIDGGSERVAGNRLINSVLDGTPPQGAVKLDVSGVDGRTTAYRIGEFTYVRTPLTLLSPGWERSVSSADGMNVYALNETPVVLLSDRGRFMRAGLRVKEGLFDE